MTALQFIKPDVQYLPSYLEVAKQGDFINMDLGLADWPASDIEKTPDAYIDAITQTGPTTVTLKDGSRFRIHNRELLWMVKDERYVGSLPLRYKADPELIENYCGHFGVAVRPDNKSRGFGVKAARLGIERLRLKGIKEIFATCSPNNTASKKIIEFLGGRLRATNANAYGAGPNLVYVIGGAG